MKYHIPTSMVEEYENEKKRKTENDDDIDMSELENKEEEEVNMAAFGFYIRKSAQNTVIALGKALSKCKLLCSVRQYVLYNILDMCDMSDMSDMSDMIYTLSMSFFICVFVNGDKCALYL